MDQATQSNASNAEQTAAASEELSAQAEQLNSVVGVLSQVVGTGGRMPALDMVGPRSNRGNGHRSATGDAPAGRARNSASHGPIRALPLKPAQGERRAGAGSLKDNILNDVRESTRDTAEAYGDLTDADFR